MATRDNHELEALANRLTSAADGIVNSAAAGLERDLRSAAGFLREIEQPEPIELLPKLESELARIANATTDPVTRARLRRLLGEA